MILAYATSRAVNRRVDGDQVRGITRHVVDMNSYACGVKDTYCGRAGVIRIGEWDADHPDNCRKCMRVLGRQEEMAP